MNSTPGRAYRRPVSADELARLENFWRDNRAAGPADEAVALTIAGILQAPSFHFRMDPDNLAAERGTASLRQWELASRLSYFLWDSMPDAELFAAAEAGRLATKAAVERQARRMLDKPEARGAVVNFHHQWLGTDQVLLVAPARRAFGPLFDLTTQLKTVDKDAVEDLEWPAVMGPVRHSMKFETELFIEQTIFDGAGTLEALMTDHHGYMSDATAPIYGANARRIPDRPTAAWSARSRRFPTLTADRSWTTP